MAVPKRRHCRSRRNMRRAHDALKAPPLVPCSNCSTAIRPHHVCPSCGHYRGRQVIPGKRV